MQWLVIDEADLVLSYGHEEDIRSIAKLACHQYKISYCTHGFCRYLPTIYQGCLTSATLLEGVLEIKSLILHNSVTNNLPSNHHVFVMSVGLVGSGCALM